MKKLAIAALLILSSVGCAGRCKDGTSKGWLGMTSDYRACGMDCTHENNEPKPCGCSSSCPCWKRHS